MVHASQGTRNIKESQFQTERASTLFTQRILTFDLRPHFARFSHRNLPFYPLNLSNNNSAGEDYGDDEPYIAENSQRTIVRFFSRRCGSKAKGQDSLLRDRTLRFCGFL